MADAPRDDRREQPPPEQHPLFRRLAALLLLARSRTPPGVLLATRFGVPLLLSAAAIAWAKSRLRSLPAIREVHYSDFIKLVQDGVIGTAAVGAGGMVCAQMTDGAALLPASAAGTLVQTRVISLPRELTELLLAKGVTVGAARASALSRAIGAFLLAAPIAYLGVISAVLWRIANDQFGGGGGAGGGPGSATKPVDSAEGGGAALVSFDQIGGIAHAKEQVLEVVDVLRHPAKFAAVGARCPRGVLLVGPPGTGKTLLARAIASNSGAAFLACAGSDFVEVFVGRGAARVRRAFERARAAAPCVLFIDELDALGRARSGTGSHGAGGFRGGGGDGASEEHEHAVIALLAELDGFSTAGGVLAVGATNRFHVLDPALVRPGRFDRVIRLRMPDSAERASILAVHMRKLARFEPEPGSSVAAALATLGARTAGLSGAELANLVNEAALAAVRAGRAAVRVSDFEEALSQYRASRSFGDGADGGADGGIDGVEEDAGSGSGGVEGGLPRALIAAILQNMQQLQGGGGRAALG